MVNRTPGLHRTEDKRIDDSAGEDGTTPAGTTATYATLRFHPKCAERLEDSIRQKRQALAVAARDAIPSVEDAIQRLQHHPDGLDATSAARIANMLNYALNVLQSSLAPGDALDTKALNRRKREMLDLQARLLAVLEQVRQVQG